MREPKVTNTLHSAENSRACDRDLPWLCSLERSEVRCQHCSQELENEFSLRNLPGLTELTKTSGLVHVGSQRYTQPWMGTGEVAVPQLCSSLQTTSCAT